eukprot:jgi/Mesen1/8749/ME000052S08178
MLNHPCYQRLRGTSLLSDMRHFPAINDNNDNISISSALSKYAAQQQQHIATQSQGSPFNSSGSLSSLDDDSHAHHHPHQQQQQRQGQQYYPRLAAQQLPGGGPGSAFAPLSDAGAQSRGPPPSLCPPQQQQLVSPHLNNGGMQRPPPHHIDTSLSMHQPRPDSYAMLPGGGMGPTGGMPGMQQSLGLPAPASGHPPPGVFPGAMGGLQHVPFPAPPPQGQPGPLLTLAVASAAAPPLWKPPRQVHQEQQVQRQVLAQRTLALQALVRRPELPGRRLLRQRLWLLRNRVSAQQARERKRQHTNELEEKCVGLESANKQLEQRIASLTQENEGLRQLVRSNMRAGGAQGGSQAAGLGSGNGGEQQQQQQQQYLGSEGFSYGLEPS